MPETKTLSGAFLQDRYVIKGYLDQGSCGQIYDLEDIKNPCDTELVVKLIKEEALFKTERQALQKINDVSQLVSHQSGLT